MFTKIKIMLKDKPERNHVKPGYDSFVHDVMTSGNKTRPKLEEHQEMARMVKELRGDMHHKCMAVSENDSLPENECRCPKCSRGLMEKISERFYGQ